MFGIGSTELLLIAVVALLVIGPKDLPRLMRTIGQWVGKAQGVARHFRSGIDTMIREAELEELEKKWRADNEAIMREFPTASLEHNPAQTADFDLAAEEAATADAATRGMTADAAPELPLEQPSVPSRPQPELP